MPYKIIVADPSPSVQKAAQLVFAEPEFRVYAFDDGASLLESVDISLRSDVPVKHSFSPCAPHDRSFPAAPAGRISSLPESYVKTN